MCLSWTEKIHLRAIEECQAESQPKFCAIVPVCNSVEASGGMAETDSRDLTEIFEVYSQAEQPQLSAIISAMLDSCVTACGSALPVTIVRPALLTVSTGDNL